VVFTQNTEKIIVHLQSLFRCIQPLANDLASHLIGQLISSPDDLEGGGGEIGRCMPKPQRKSVAQRIDQNLGLGSSRRKLTIDVFQLYDSGLGHTDPLHGLEVIFYKFLAQILEGISKNRLD
jgi:hypothetical protein